MSKSLKQDVINVVRKYRQCNRTVDSNRDYCEHIECDPHPHVECDSHPHAYGLYTCYNCGKLTSTAYHDDNGRAICSNCRRKKRRIARTTNYNFVIEDREYSKEEVLEILKKHKAEEDKRYCKCERCGTRYLENNKFNMVTYNLDKQSDTCSSWGYAITPYIKGFKISSTCGNGKEIKLCDNCIGELIIWIGEFKHE